MNFLKSLAATALLCGAAAVANAQVATQITQTGTMLNASAFNQTIANGATGCATVNTTAANGTVTITPPAGQFVYITNVSIDIASDTTGNTQVATMSTTNISGTPIWSLATIAPTASSAGQFRQISETYATPLKSTAAGTAVTFVPSAQTNHVIFCTRVAGFFAP